MSSKDYVEIAGVIEGYMAIATDEQGWMLSRLASDLVPIFEKGNRRFDADRFLAACGVGVDDAT